MRIVRNMWKKDVLTLDEAFEEAGNSKLGQNIKPTVKMQNQLKMHF